MMARRTTAADLPPSVLSARDRRILSDLARVRMLTGRQLERLHFADLATANARGSARRRSLGRLVSQGWVATLPRRVGGERAGSAGLVYALDSRAHRERPLWDETATWQSDTRVRRPWAIGWLFVRHNLDVAELYVRLREAEGSSRLLLLRFDAEPAAWFQTDVGGTLKPDAHVVVEVDGWERHWWIEVDRATESLPTLGRKLGRYLDLLRIGGAGPDGVLPRVLVTVPNSRRAAPVCALIKQLRVADPGYITVTTFPDALSVLPGDQPRPPP